MARVNIQDRTNEFRSILQQASHRQKSKLSQQRQSLLTDSQRKDASASPARQRSDFAKRATEISRGISATMAKLERLAQLARRKTLFDDRPVEINELTYIIKQDLSALDNNIKSLQQLSATQQPKHEEGEHNKNVVFLLRGKLGEITGQFKDTLELRTKNIQASRTRTENFISSVSAASNPNSMNPSRTDSPLYQTPQQTQGRKSPSGGAPGTAAGDILSLDPNPSSSALTRSAPASSQQLMLMEEGGSNTYIQARGEAVRHTFTPLWSHSDRC
jgi:syntaxin 5